MSEQKSPTFELVLNVKDRNGNPTGMKKYFGTDTAEDLANHWNRNGGGFWEDKNFEKPFLFGEIPSREDRPKQNKSFDSARAILLKRISKLSKTNPSRMADGESIISENTIKTASEVVNCIADSIRVKVKIVTNKLGAIILEFNSYLGIEQSLELSILNNDVSYNFWNGSVEDQEHKDYSIFDRVKIRQLVNKFNKGLKN